MQLLYRLLLVIFLIDIYMIALFAPVQLHSIGTSYIYTVHPSTILRIFNQFIMKFSKWFNHESSSAHICPSFLISSFCTRLILINISKRLMMWYDVNGIWSKASHFTASSHRFLFHGTHFGGILVTSRKKNIKRFRTSLWYEMTGSEQERHMWERRAAVDVSLQYNIHFQWKYGTFAALHSQEHSAHRNRFLVSFSYKNQFLCDIPCARRFRMCACCA